MATLSIIILVALFAATLIPAFDLGLGALAAAFLIGLAADVATDDVTGFFPADFFVLIVGVTALFAVAHLNGTLDWLLDLLLRLVRGRLVLIVLVPFVIGAVLTAVGTLPAAATAIVSPIALGFAARYRISPLIAAVLGVTGIISGLLSPLAVYGVTARELSEKQGLGLPGSAPVTFLLGGLVTGLVVCTALLVVGTRTGAVPPGRISGAPRPATPDGTAPDDLAPDDPAPGGGGSGGGGSEAPGAASVSTAKGGTATVVSTPPGGDGRPAPRRPRPHDRRPARGRRPLRRMGHARRLPRRHRGAAPAAGVPAAVRRDRLPDPVERGAADRRAADLRRPDAAPGRVQADQRHAQGGRLAPCSACWCSATSPGSPRSPPAPSRCS
ncbi:hypothetical protein LUX39_17050 [Actinomadura madurae]|nr:hypothetical protein [Actinomadura madurae]MCQ0015224.1 hypothetical protein [Actinomadura madurae]